MEGAQRIGSSFSLTSGRVTQERYVGFFSLAKVSRLVNEVYHMYNRHQYPFILLNVCAESGCVDINVTPDKRQILLQEEKLLLAILKTSLMGMFGTDVNKLVLNQKLIDLEASPLETSTSPSPPDRNETSKIHLAVARLKESFSRGQTSAFQDSEKAQPKERPPNLGLRQMFAGFSASPRKKTMPGKASEDGNEVISRKSSLAGRKLENSTEDTDSGLGSVSAESDGGFGPSEMGVRFRAESMAGSPKGEPPVFSGEIQSSDGGSSGVFCPSEPNQGKEDNSFSQPATFSPKAKRFKIHQAISPNFSERTAEQDSQPLYDIPVKLEKRTVPLALTWSTLADRIRRQIKRQETEGEMLKCRKFRAKISPEENKMAEDELRKEISKEMFAKMDIVGQFNLGFIIAKLKSDLFIIDQHATDEKYNFEMLQEDTVLQGQKLIKPQNLNLTAVSESILMDNLEIFQKNGFDFVVDENAKLKGMDVELSTLLLLQVMIGTALTAGEMKKLITHMGEIEHPWNCPHGRPTIRHLANLDLITQD
ncbi:hypothetical protein Chor_015250 [Crotalus horridus]